MQGSWDKHKVQGARWERIGTLLTVAQRGMVRWNTEAGATEEGRESGHVFKMEEAEEAWRAAWGGRAVVWRHRAAARPRRRRLGRRGSGGRGGQQRCGGGEGGVREVIAKCAKSELRRVCWRTARDPGMQGGTVVRKSNDSRSCRLLLEAASQGVGPSD